MGKKWLAILGCVASCSTIDPKRAAQESLAEELTPAPAPEAPDRPARKLVVRVWADETHRRAVVGWPSRIRDQIEDANRVFARHGVRLEMDEAKAWARESGSGSLESAMRLLVELDPGEGADFVIGLIAPLEISTSSFHQLGMAQLLGKHIVIRPLDDRAEHNALREVLYKLSADERERVYQRRLRHKSRTVLLHELGHALGALHTAEDEEIMRWQYSAEATRFCPENTEIIALALEARGQNAPSSEEAVRARILAKLQATTRHPWIGHSREKMIAWLGGPNKYAEHDKESEGPGEEAGENEDPAKRDAADLAAAAERLNAGDVRTAQEILHAFLDRSPDNPTALTLMCEVALRRDEKTAEPDCKRAFEAAPNEPAPPLRLAYLAINIKDEPRALTYLSAAEQRLSAQQGSTPEAWAHLAVLYRETHAPTAAARAAAKAPAHEDARETSAWADRTIAKYGPPPGLDDTAEANYVRTFSAAEEALARGNISAAEKIAAQLGAAADKLSLLFCESLARSPKPMSAKKWCLKSGEEPRALMVLGFLDLAAGKNSTAVATLQRAKKLAPDRPEVWTLLATALQAAGKNKELAALRAEHQTRFGRELR